MNLLYTLDLGDYVTLCVALVTLITLILVRAQKFKAPPSPDMLTFRMELIRNNSGLLWAFVVFLVALVALFHASNDEHTDAAVVESLKNVMIGAAAWMGAMLTGRAPRTTDHGDLTPGTSGTQDVVVTTHKETVTAPAPPVDPATPIVVSKIVEAVTVKSEEPKP